MNTTASPAAVLATGTSNERWRILLLSSALVLVAFVFAMQGTLLSLLNLWWNNSAYGHGLVVLATCVYLLYLRRGEMVANEIQISLPGLLITCVLIGIWLASRVLSVLIGEQVILVLLVLSLILALYGAQMARTFLLPVLYLFCAVPIWSYLLPILQSSTAQAATWMSRSLGVPLYLEGVYMTIPDGVFLVADVCAGVSYLLAAMSLGGFYALLNLHSGWTRVVLFVLATGAGVVFNWVRVTGIVLIGHHSRMQSPLVHEHLMAGWVLFVLVVFFVMVCGRILERFDGQAVAKAQSTDTQDMKTVVSGKSTLAMAVVCGAVLSVPAYAAMRLASPPSEPIVVRLSQQLGGGSGWRVADPADIAWSVSIQGPDAQARATYINGEQQIDLQLGYFASQREGAEAVNELHAVYDREDWRRVTQTVVAEQLSVAPGLKVNEVEIQHQHAAERRLVWWWYWVDQEFTADRVQAKVLQIRSLFSGNSQAAILLVSSPVSRSVEETRDMMRNWLRDSSTPLAADLRQIAQP